MKITKYVHACLLVEMPAPVNRTALFDPGVMSEAALDVDQLQYLDDIIITHEHSDHFSPDLTQRLYARFPGVRVTATPAVVEQLSAAGINASSQPSNGIAFFDSPHASVQPLWPQPQQNGVHYLDRLTHPGDSHEFDHTMPVLALPVTAPWGSMMAAVNLALRLQPRYIIPIHDWHWRDEAREQAYANLEQFFAGKGIKFVGLQSGEPVVLDV